MLKRYKDWNVFLKLIWEDKHHFQGKLFKQTTAILPHP